MTSNAFAVDVTPLPGGRPHLITGTVGSFAFARQLDYDARHRLTNLGANLGGTLWNVGRTYYPNGRVESLTDNLRPSWSYAYDPANRLFTATEGTSPPIVYGYNENGSLASVMNDGHNETYEYEAPNKDKLQAISGPGKEIAAAMGAEGRLCGYTDQYEAARQFSWYPDGTLGTVTYQRWNPPLAIQVDYDYDENGSRWRRRKGSESDLYFDALAEMKDQELTEYVRIPYATIELRSAGHRISFSDGLNTAVVVNDQGTMQHLSEYLPYGTKEVLIGAPPDTTFNFNEKRREPNIETLYYGARDYDPILRQFLSVDPLRLEGVSDALDRGNLLQPYVYAGSDPVTFTDNGNEMTLAQFMRMDPQMNAYMADQVAQGAAAVLYRVPIAGSIFNHAHAVMWGQTYFERQAGEAPAANRVVHLLVGSGEVALAVTGINAIRAALTTSPGLLLPAAGSTGALSTQEMMQMMAAARAACAGGDCAMMSRMLMAQTGRGELVTLFPKTGTGILPTLPGVAPEAWAYHTGVLLEEGAVLDPLRNMIFPTLQAFVLGTVGANPIGVMIGGAMLP